eukprot:TRINITY_DN15_c0_g1_i2.p1 TRINITY_DN15_c0_g1~~TRINITY_DN15_c0_g1_i2.p1  ORF type:complete len:488 (-),score=72.77 TRINITY_DN15_c0_g1_i2:147-1610(-)
MGNRPSQGRSEVNVSSSKAIAQLPGDLDTFKSLFSGTIALPGMPEYEANRVIWNHDACGYPSAIVTVQTEQDVVQVVNYARENNCCLCIASGRHGHLCMLDDSLVMDMSAMKKCVVDKEAMTVTAESGVKLLDLDDACHKEDVVVPSGTNPDTGIAGLTLGGGVGFLVRRFGLTLDALLSVRIVLANGQILTASETENEDLFWGVRGGSGNFGVVTEFTFRCFPIPREVLGGSKVYVFNSLPLIKQFLTPSLVILEKYFLEYLKDAPNDVGSLVVLPIGGPTIIAWTYAGTVEEGKPELNRLNDMMPFTPIDNIQPTSYHKGVQIIAEGPNRDKQRSGFYFEKGVLIESLTLDLLRILDDIHHGSLPEGVEGTFIIVTLGGKMSEIKASDTAYEFRGANFWILVLSKWEKPEHKEGAVRWNRDVYDLLKPFACGVYAPVIASGSQSHAEDDELFVGLVYRGNLERLIELKRLYDPGNLFRTNRNIKP